ASTSTYYSSITSATGRLVIATSASVSLYGPVSVYELQSLSFSGTFLLFGNATVTNAVLTGPGVLNALAPITIQGTLTLPSSLTATISSGASFVVSGSSLTDSTVART